MKKRVMLLGGNYFQMTATKAAKELGYHVISVDYLPQNPAHKYADEYYNVSTTDKESILALATKLKVDGIVSYASDVSAPTAAYVAEKLGLPTNPYESVYLLTRKDLINEFKATHGFLVPQSKAFSIYIEALDFFEKIKKPAMIKPVDASGSKGINKVYKNEDFQVAFQEAMQYSKEKIVIVEEFLIRKGYQVAGDGFLWNGKLVFNGLMNEHFEKFCNGLVPIGESYPSVLNLDLQEKARHEIERLMKLLGMRFGAINLDFMIDESDNIYILEVGPRNGGNLITDVIKYASGIDLAQYTIKAAVGENCEDLHEAPIKKMVSSYIVHGVTDGYYKGLSFANNVEKDIILSDLFIKPGDKIKKFDNASFSYGAMIIQHSSLAEMLDRMDNMEKYIKVITANE